MIEREYLELFSERITLYPPSTKDKYGKTTFAASGVSACAHLMAEESVSRDIEGREVVQTGKAYVYGTPTVDTTYKIVLDSGNSPVILSVDVVPDNNGPHHTVIRFGR